MPRVTGSSGTTIRTGSKSGRASTSGSEPSGRSHRSDGVPLPSDTSRSRPDPEEADWVASEVVRRIAGGAAAGDHAILLRSNAEADPILRSLNLAGVPWRFSGTSGLYARPEVRLLLAFLRAVADLASSVDIYALAASDVYGLGGDDLTAIVASARRRNRSIWDVLEEVDRQPGLLRLAPATRRAVSRFVADLRRYAELAHVRPAGEVLYSFLRDSGWLARHAGANDPASEEAVQNVARFFDIVRAQSAVLVDDRCVFVAGHLKTLIEAGDDPPTADLDSDADAVAVLTVHRAKGLEFTTVFMFAATPLEGYLACGAAVRDMDHRELLPRISAPTLVIAGKHDPATPPEANEYISKHVAGARLALLDAAHLSNIEQPQAYTKTVLEFLLGR